MRDRGSRGKWMYCITGTQSEDVYDLLKYNNFRKIVVATSSSFKELEDMMKKLMEVSQ